MTTAVERKKHLSQMGSQGQSTLELLLLLPMVLGVVMLLIRVNTVIQISIVDQKYAREQALFIAGNAADYPMRPAVVTTLAGNGSSYSNQLVMGVSENTPTGSNGSDADLETNNTLASTFNIGRASNNLGNGGTQVEPAMRTSVRVRNTVNMCLPLLAAKGKPIFNQTSGEYTMPERAGDYSGQYCTSTIAMQNGVP